MPITITRFLLSGAFASYSGGQLALIARQKMQAIALKNLRLNRMISVGKWRVAAGKLVPEETRNRKYLFSAVTSVGLTTDYHFAASKGFPNLNENTNVGLYKIKETDQVIRVYDSTVCYAADSHIVRDDPELLEKHDVLAARVLNVPVDTVCHVFGKIRHDKTIEAIAIGTRQQLENEIDESLRRENDRFPFDTAVWTLCLVLSLILMT